MTRVIVIAAHPDEPEEYAGGTAALYSRRGHSVKFMSLTNGSAGHHELDAPALVARRAREAALAADRLGVAQYEILPIDDGSLMPTLEVRQAVIRGIREWRADVVISFHADGGGHPDNRASAVAVRDALPFVTLNNILPEVAPLRARPLHLLMVDYGTHDLHRHDVALDITSVLEDKLLGCDAHASQFYEFAPYCDRVEADVPRDWPGRREFILKNWSAYFHASPQMRPALARYGGDPSAEFAESFALGPGSRATSEERVRALLP